MIEQIYTFFTIDMIYLWLNIGVIPFWIILLFFPQSKISSFFVSSIFPYFLFGAIYIYLLYYVFIQDYDFFVFHSAKSEILSDYREFVFFEFESRSVPVYAGNISINSSQWKSGDKIKWTFDW